jgi:exodeoxyribonuclease VII large subunit
MLESHPIFNTGLKEFSVTELSIKIKSCIEQNIGYARVRGEVSGLKIAASGHAYFNLKDNDAILATTCWRQVLSRLKFQPTEGMQIVVTGKITTYAGQSRYQLSAEQIEPAGLGAMMQILQERRERLEKEGLFSSAHKKPLPFMPATIGVVTSITGAVIRDIIHRISDRFPTRVIIWPVTVQGESAASEITYAINAFNKIESKDRPDLIIVARGGGSVEDLWPFNEENVVRAVYASNIPVISAVGHETDYTLIDLVADRRAPTPTAAAEFAVPVLTDLQSSLVLTHGRILTRIKQHIFYKEQLLSSYRRIDTYPINLLYNIEQKLDELTFRLNAALPKLLQAKSQHMSSFHIRRLNPSKLIEYKALELSHKSNLQKLAFNQIEFFKNKLVMQSNLLKSLDYKNVLNRGFALVKNTSDGKVLSSKFTAEQQKRLKVEFHDGSLELSNLSSR